MRFYPGGRFAPLSYEEGRALPDSRPVTVLDDLPARLAASATQVESTFAAWKLALRQRDALIVEAVDAGMRQGVVATTAGVSSPHVTRVLANAGSDDDPVHAA